MEVSKTIPMFRIFDVAVAKAFYVDYLGFRVDFEHQVFEGSPWVIQVSRGGLSILLTEHHGDCCPGSAVIVWIIGLDDFHRELQSRAYRMLHPGIEIAPWGARLMKILDPFGNKILFSEKHDSSRD